MCKATKIPRSSFYYGKKSEALWKEKDAVVLEAIKHLEPVEIKKCGSKRKSQLLKRKGISVNHKRVARICKEAGIETTNRRRKFPKNYYIEYYNNRRIQKKLNWMTPIEFRSKRCY